MRRLKYTILVPPVSYHTQHRYARSASALGILGPFTHVFGTRAFCKSLRSIAPGVACWCVVLSLHHHNRHNAHTHTGKSHTGAYVECTRYAHAPLTCNGNEMWQAAVFAEQRRRRRRRAKHIATAKAPRARSRRACSCWPRVMCDVMCWWMERAETVRAGARHNVFYVMRKSGE